MSSNWECSGCLTVNNNTMNCIMCNLHFSMRIRRCIECYAINQPLDETCGECGIMRNVFKRVTPTQHTTPPCGAPIMPTHDTHIMPTPPRGVPKDVMDHAFVRQCKCVGCTRNRQNIAKSLEGCDPNKWHADFILGEGKFYKCINEEVSYVDETTLIKSMLGVKAGHMEIVHLLKRLKQPCDTSAPEVEPSIDAYVVQCPHCDHFTELSVKDVNCGVYRHSDLEVPPHATAEQIRIATAKNPSHGCLRGIAIKKVNGILRLYPTTLNDRIIAE